LLGTRTDRPSTVRDGGRARGNPRARSVPRL